MWFFWAPWLLLTSQKHASGQIGDSKLPLGVKERVNVCGVLPWTGIPSRMCSRLVPSVPGLCHDSDQHKVAINKDNNE